MAESVDALVSNTSRFTPVPVRPRLWVQKGESSTFSFFYFINLISRRIFFQIKIPISFVYNKKVVSLHRNSAKELP